VLPVRAGDLLTDPGGDTLFAAYAEECSIPAIGKPNPQPEIYQMMEEAGLLKCFGLYDGPTLVGFASVLVTVLPHYGKQAATVESIFVSREYRDGIGSAKLLNNVEAFAGATGCVVILYIAPVGSEFAQFLEGRDKYERTNSVFCRRLA
jgi:hypothetical protein